MTYGILSRQRSQLMGLAMLWVMLFHAYNFYFGLPPLDAVKKAALRGWMSLFCSRPWAFMSPLESRGRRPAFAAFTAGGW